MYGVFGFAAVIQKQSPEEKPKVESIPSTSSGSKKVNRPKDGRKISRVLGSNSVVNEHKSGAGNRSGSLIFF